MSDSEDKNNGYVAICCIGVVIIALIIAGSFLNVVLIM